MKSTRYLQPAYRTCRNCCKRFSLADFVAVGVRSGYKLIARASLDVLSRECPLVLQQTEVDKVY
ncbi:MAG TPA: hypothetical protein DD473_07575 [Planctomycetaceae bacterium]|nr:hypothetical protein [Planctomycetaceae bacterium]